jgi:hypothetical protein
MLWRCCVQRLGKEQGCKIRAFSGNTPAMQSTQLQNDAAVAADDGYATNCHQQMQFQQHGGSNLCYLKLLL